MQPTPLEYGRRAPGRLQSLGRALRHPNYRLFFAGQFISLCGTFLTQTAMVWLVYSLTGSGKILGLTAFAGQVPTFVLGPFAGVWVDRLNRRKLIVITQALAMTQSFLLAALVFFFRANSIVVPGLIALAACQGLINSFDMPGRQAFLVEMVDDREDLANAIALNSTMVHGARLIGPTIAGILLHYVGATLCFLLDGASYIAVLAALLAMRIKPRPSRSAGTSVLAELKEGLDYVWRFAPMRAMLLLMSLLSLTAMPAFSVLMPIFATALSSQGDGDKTLGFLMAASASGALAGALYLAARKSVLGLGRLIALASCAFGLVLIAFSFSKLLWLSLLIVPLGGCAMLIAFASSNTLLQTLTDDEKRGRVMSFFTMAFVGMTPWGNLLSGFSADALASGPTPQGHLVGASRTLQIAGCICMLAGLSFALKLPSIRRVLRPIYQHRGILPRELATGLRDGTELVSGHEQQ